MPLSIQGSFNDHILINVVSLQLSNAYLSNGTIIVTKNSSMNGKRLKTAATLPAAVCDML